MNISPTDDDLARAHDMFRRNHDAGRRRLLEMLSSEDFTTAPYRSLSLPSRVTSKLALAATILVALALGLYTWHGGARRAYALEDLPNRLLDIRSIYVSGWVFRPFADAPKQPLTLFAERPNRYWCTWSSYSGPDQSHKEARISSGYHAGNGREGLSVSPHDKTASTFDVPPLVGELTTESLIQTEIPRELLDGDIRDFARTGSERVNDRRCDVYERVAGASRSRIWLDPTTGLPVKIARYEIDEAGNETLRQIIDHVEVNVLASAKGLSFTPPEGCQTTRRTISDAEREASMPILYASGGYDSATVAVSYGLNIDDRAVLVCWSYVADSNDDSPQVVVDFMLDKTRECDRIDVAAVELGGQPWKWSLLLPKKKSERIGYDELQVVLHPEKKGGLTSIAQVPIRFSADRLRSVIEEIQQVSKTVPAGAKPFTLDMLRARLDAAR